jgi:hypothetical protein
VWLTKLAHKLVSLFPDCEKLATMRKVGCQAASCKVYSRLHAMYMQGCEALLWKGGLCHYVNSVVRRYHKLPNRYRQLRSLQKSEGYLQYSTSLTCSPLQKNGPQYCFVQGDWQCTLIANLQITISKADCKKTMATTFHIIMESNACKVYVNCTPCTIGKCILCGEYSTLDHRALFSAQCTLTTNLQITSAYCTLQVGCQQRRYDTHHEMLTQRNPSCHHVNTKKGHAESAFRGGILWVVRLQAAKCM